MTYVISIHALLAESDGCPQPCGRPTKDFYPRSPCGERLLDLTFHERASIISIHALLAESDPPFVRLFNGKAYFYPRSPCGERPAKSRQTLCRISISIHALLAESDQVKQTCQEEISISIHALLAESDGGSGVGSWPHGIFLSTLSLRRATEREYQHLTNLEHFYPRSPCGERPNPKIRLSLTIMISIHALLAESDQRT